MNELAIDSELARLRPAWRRKHRRRRMMSAMRGNQRPAQSRADSRGRAHVGSASLRQRADSAAPRIPDNRAFPRRATGNRRHSRRKPFDITSGWRWRRISPAHRGKVIAGQLHVAAMREGLFEGARRFLELAQFAQQAAASTPREARSPRSSSAARAKAAERRTRRESQISLAQGQPARRLPRRQRKRLRTPRQRLPLSLRFMGKAQTGSRLGEEGSAWLPAVPGPRGRPREPRSTRTGRERASDPAARSRDGEAAEFTKMHGLGNDFVVLDGIRAERRRSRRRSSGCSPTGASASAATRSWWSSARRAPTRISATGSTTRTAARSSSAATARAAS